MSLVPLRSYLFPSNFHISHYPKRPRASSTAMIRNWREKKTWRKRRNYGQRRRLKFYFDIAILSLGRNCGQRKRLFFFSISQHKSCQKYQHHGDLSAISSQCKAQHKIFLYQNMCNNHSNNTLDLQKKLLELTAALSILTAMAAVPMRSTMPKITKQTFKCMLYLNY